MASVLVIDDDPEIRDLCRTILATEGHQVLEAPDAPSGVAMAREHLPDLVLLDWMLPGVDGIEALRILKSSANTRQIPVLMLTALDGIADIALATHSGADGYITKPFEPSALVAVVRRYSETRPTG